MKHVLVIGCGLSGLCCAVTLAQMGHSVTLAAPYAPERSQSVLAAGGINAVEPSSAEGDTVACHVDDTLRGGGYLASRAAVERMCADAPEVLSWLEGLGVCFTRREDGGIDRRAFGGHSHRRTAFAGTATGKQIMFSLIRYARRLIGEGRITYRLGMRFHSALIAQGRCYGALMLQDATGTLVPIYADATVMAVGGPNTLFGKTTGSTLCDGYAAGRLLMQGVVLKDLEFIQYHPTAAETADKHLLISEAVRGEGGRLYYLDGDRRVYFMEELYGPEGNRMPRDVVTRHIAQAGRTVYLDVSFLGAARIRERLHETWELCRAYLGIDITQQSLPVAPAVHFFMGGIAVDASHRTSVDGLFAVGECASMYHGANRLGANSLLSAIHGARVAAQAMDQDPRSFVPPDLTEVIRHARAAIETPTANGCSAQAIDRALAACLRTSLGIVRDERTLAAGVSQVDALLAQVRASGVRGTTVYESYRTQARLVLARAMLTCAQARRETRGAHVRADHLAAHEDAVSSLLTYDAGAYTVWYRKEDAICW